MEVDRDASPMSRTSHQAKLSLFLVTSCLEFLQWRISLDMYLDLAKSCPLDLCLVNDGLLIKQDSGFFEPG
jgi:hypothetical protein